MFQVLVRAHLPVGCHLLWFGNSNKQASIGEVLVGVLAFMLDDFLQAITPENPCGRLLGNKQLEEAFWVSFDVVFHHSILNPLTYCCFVIATFT